MGWVRDVQRLHPGYALTFDEGPSEASVRWAELAHQHDVLDRDVVRSLKKRGTLGFFEALVTYRNAVLGHGAQRVRTFYEQITPPLIEAVLEHVDRIPWLAGGQLVGRDEDGACHRLAGLAALPTDPFEAEEGLYVAGEQRVPLGPFVRAAIDPALDRQRIVFLNRVVVRRSSVARAEYLDCATGEGVELDPAPLRGLLDDSGPSDDTVEERVDDYELGEVLGVGAMGIVRRATQVGLGRPVALKSLSDALALDPTARRRFEREVRALARCDHPNVVKVLRTHPARSMSASKRRQSCGPSIPGYSTAT